VHRVQVIVVFCVVSLSVVVASGTRGGAEVLGPPCPAGDLRIVVGEVAAVGPCVPIRLLPSRDLRRSARRLERQVEECGPGGVVLRVTERRGTELACRVSV
jgi:hypothetical protein